MKLHDDPAIDGRLKSLLFAVECSCLDGDSNFLSLARDEELARAVGWTVEDVALGLGLLEMAGAVWILASSETGWDQRAILPSHAPFWGPMLARFHGRPLASPEVRQAVVEQILEFRRKAFDNNA
jgi:hypothetical protein